MTKQEMRDFAINQVEWYKKEITWCKEQIAWINDQLKRTRKEDKEMVAYVMENYSDNRFTQEIYKDGYKGTETKKLTNQRNKQYRDIKKYESYIEYYEQEAIKYSDEDSQEAQETFNDTTTNEIEEQATETSAINQQASSTKKISFEIREIDAWMYDDDWTWNTSYHMGEMVTRARDERRAFTAWLKRHLGVSFKKNRTLIEYDGDVYTIVDRKTKEPLFAAIPQF